MRAGPKHLKNRASRASVAPSDEAALSALEAEGAITRGRGRAGSFRPAKLLKKGVRVSDLLIEDRGPRG